MSKKMYTRLIKCNLKFITSINNAVDPHYLETEFCRSGYPFLNYQIIYFTCHSVIVLLYQRFSSFVKQKILILFNIL